MNERITTATSGCRRKGSDCYAPNKYYSAFLEFVEVLEEVTSGDPLVLMGDLSAHMGNDGVIWKEQPP